MNYKDLPKNEQPINRVCELGATAVTISELFSVVLKKHDRDITDQLAELYHKRGSLANITDKDLTDIKGISTANVATVRAIIEFGRRETVEKEPRPKISSPADAANLVMYEMGSLQREELWVMILNTRNEVLEIDKVYKGCVNACTVRVGELFKKAIELNAPAMIVLHNHPSGDPTPSPDDVGITRAIVESGNLLDIQILDHLVVGQGRFVSMKERRLGFN